MNSKEKPGRHLHVEGFEGIGHTTTLQALLPRTNSLAMKCKFRYSSSFE
jgi:hypothetical protein